MAYRSSTYRTGANSASPTFAVPAGAAVDDIAVVAMMVLATGAITPPTGFTQKYDSGHTAAYRQVVFWKRLTAADSGDYTFTIPVSDWVEGVTVLYSGRVTTGDPFTATGSATIGSATSLTVTAITAAANDDLVGVGISWNGGAWTPPSGMTERQDTGAEVTLDTADAVASGSTGDKTFTYSGAASGMKAFLGALAVASGGTTPISGTDTAAGADSGALAASQTATDTGAGTDSASPAAALTGSDTGTGADAASLVVSITATDTATGVDTASVDTGATAKAGDDTGTAADTASTAATESGADTGTGTDQGAVTASVVAADTATAVDSAFVTVTLTGTDTASASDLAALAIAVAASDLATALDTASAVVAGAVTPTERTIVVPAENRVTVVPPENRVVVVPAENRTMEA